MRLTIYLLSLFVAFTFTEMNAQTPQPAEYRFQAGAGVACQGGFAWNGFSSNSSYSWMIQGPSANYTSPIGGYIAFSWTLSDEAGTLATGSFDSRTGESTGGTFALSFQFTTNRLPYGKPVFRASGSGKIAGPTFTACDISFLASSDQTSAGGGYFFLAFDPAKRFKLQAVASNLILTVPGSSTADGQVVVQDADANSPNQLWQLGTGGTYEGLEIKNIATQKLLLFAAPNSQLYQGSTGNSSIRILSAGDGTFFLTYDDYVAGSTMPPQSTSYALQPSGGSTSAGSYIDFVQRNGSQIQTWRIIPVP